MLRRRSFMAGTIGVGATLVMQGPRHAAAQADRRMIVDAQVHLWKAETPDWKWVPGRQPQLPEPFTIERLVPMIRITSQTLAMRSCENRTLPNY